MELTADQLLTIRRTLRSLKFGQLTIDVADGRIVEIGRRVQTRHLKRRHFWKASRDRNESGNDVIEVGFPDG